MRKTARRTHAPLLALVAVALAVGLAGCSSGQDADGGDSTAAGSSLDAGSSEAQRDGVPAAEAPAPNGSLAYADADAALESKAEAEPAVNEQQLQRAVIRKGNVELRSDDVAKAQFGVENIAKRYFGEITDEKTTTDDDGNAAYTSLVLRVPTEKFADAMGDLKGLETAEFVGANSSENDVTTKLIDTQTRLAAQKRSIARITVLFDRAESIRDIMAIEAELSRRQADLDSLERQAAFLRGQSAMSTITVSIDQIPEEKAAPKPKDDDEAGFVAGFKAGWDALTAFAVGVATAVGALLPWIVVVAILGPPVWLLVRAIRRRLSAGRTARTPSAA